MENKVFEPLTINSQEELDNIIKDRIGRLNKQHLEATAELQSKLDSANSLIEDYRKNEEEAKGKTSAEVEELKKQIAKYETDSVKTKVAIEIGLPLEMRDRLRGNTEEEITADAQALLSLIPKPSAPSRSTETVINPEDASRQELREMLKNL